MLGLEVVVDQSVNNVVCVLSDELQADWLQVGSNIVTDLSKEISHSLHYKAVDSVVLPGLCYLFIVLVYDVLIQGRHDRLADCAGQDVS